MRIKQIKMRLALLLAVIIMGIGVASAVLVVYADTDGNELRITDRPDRFILQLGADWAGAEFELKLDYGVFPVPIIVDPAGTLTMELGGSSTYTLTRLSAESYVPDDTAQPAADISEAEGETVNGNEIPVLHMILFLSGLILAVGALLIMRMQKRRRENADNDSSGYDDYI